MPRIRLATFAQLACAMVCAPALLGAQSASTVSQADLLGKTFFLRSLCAGDELHFSVDGRPTSACNPEPFTLGLLTIDKVEGSGKELKLTAHRVGLAFQDSVPRRIDLAHPVQGRKPHDVVLHIDLAPSDSGATQVAAILTTNLSDLLPVIPEAWQGFFQQFVLTPQHAPAAAAPVAAAKAETLTQDQIDREQINPMIADEGEADSKTSSEPKLRDVPYPWAQGIPDKSGKDGVSVPKVTHMRDANFSEQARSMRYSGKCVVKFLLDEHGDMQHPYIQAAAGLGLDEQALVSLRQYRFQPAMKNGKAVPVVMRIEVAFESY